jgi:ribosomal protein L6P/L9E
MGAARNIAACEFRIKLGHKHPIVFVLKNHIVVDFNVPTSLYVQGSGGL